MRLSIQQLNQLEAAEFVRRLGGVFEGAPWVAQKVVGKRPFRDRDHILRLMCDALRRAGPEKQLELFRAHPDLVGEAARTGKLSAASAGEQTAAGLMELSPEDARWFERYNRAYREKYGFPFIFCVRAFKPAAVRRAILDSFEMRLHNDTDRERDTALGEIGKIAEFRLRDLVS
jgi:OHCU decarboxylase